MTLLREARKWWNLEIENEGDLLDIVIERPEDLDQLTFNWKMIGFDMANDGLANNHRNGLSRGQRSKKNFFLAKERGCTLKTPFPRRIGGSKPRFGGRMGCGKDKRKRGVRDGVGERRGKGLGSSDG